LVCLNHLIVSPVVLQPSRLPMMPCWAMAFPWPCHLIQAAKVMALVPPEGSMGPITIRSPAVSKWTAYP
jgi:hypothetical protein